MEVASACLLCGEASSYRCEQLNIEQFDPIYRSFFCVQHFVERMKNILLCKIGQSRNVHQIIQFSTHHDTLRYFKHLINEKRNNRRRFRCYTYSYKKVNHEKYIECEIDLLCDVFAKICANFHIFIRCIDEINN